jgi:hypothetical protein
VSRRSKAIVFAVELDKTGWRVTDGCLNFGPYSGRPEAEDVAKALNKMDWSADNAAPLSAIELPDLEGPSSGRTVN